MLRRSAVREASASDPSSRCLDAETLAAWIDGDLTAADVSAAEAHVSSCARCQAMVAAIVRTAPSAPALVPCWRRGWAIGALVPLTAGAVAIAVYIATPNVEQSSAPAVANRQTRAIAPSQREQESKVDAPVAPQASTAPQLAAPQPTGRSLQTVAPQADARANEFRAPQAAAAEQFKKESADAVRRNETAAASVQAPAAPPPPAAAPAASAPASERADAANFAGGAARLRDTAATAPQREAFLAKSATLERAAVVPAEIISPDRSVRWRPGASGSIQRSTDGGATWTQLSSGAT